VYFVAGPEFGELSRHTLLINKALYGLRTSGAQSNESILQANSSQIVTPPKTIWEALVGCGLFSRMDTMQTMLVCQAFNLGFNSV
jgi:hypothetical protein